MGLDAKTGLDGRGGGLDGHGVQVGVGQADTACMKAGLGGEAWTGRT